MLKKLAAKMEGLAAKMDGGGGGGSLIGKQLAVGGQMVKVDKLLGEVRVPCVVAGGTDACPELASCRLAGWWVLHGLQAQRPRACLAPSLAPSPLQGGFATIYRCVDVDTGVTYALKHFILTCAGCPEGQPWQRRTPRRLGTAAAVPAALHAPPRCQPAASVTPPLSSFSACSAYPDAEYDAQKEVAVMQALHACPAAVRLHAAAPVGAPGGEPTAACALMEYCPGTLVGGAVGGLV